MALVSSIAVGYALWSAVTLFISKRWLIVVMYVCLTVDAHDFVVYFCLSWERAVHSVAA